MTYDNGDQLSGARKSYYMERDRLSSNFLLQCLRSALLRSKVAWDLLPHHSQVQEAQHVRTIYGVHGAGRTTSPLKSTMSVNVHLWSPYEFYEALIASAVA